MPLTRSASRAAAISNGVVINPQKRKVDESTRISSKRPRARKSAVTIASGSLPDTEQIVPATLTFSFEEGRKHLVSADGRFEKLFNKMPCKPFEHLEAVHPFRSLTTSILGQQISWMAARSINHRFRRLFDPSLPEQPTDDTRSSFPSPEQVSSASIETLKSAGLSTRKAEYVKDLASRFVDGRLSTRKLMEASDEDLARMLMEVRGIGRWTVDMFSIFSMRRPNILPVGDLGVQRGLLRWFLSLHSSDHSFGTKSTNNEVSSSNQKSEDMGSLEDEAASPSLVPLNINSGALGDIPPPFTPRTKSSLEHYAPEESKLRTLPSGLSVTVLKNRLEGKKIKGAFLTPLEMEELTESWNPYRSLGVYYMWSL